MGRGAPLARRPGKRPELRRILIYCEGERTEDQYFRGLRADLQGVPVRIELGPAHGVPTELVRAAVKHKRRAPTSRTDRCEPYDEVWCVMDVEAPVRHPGLDEALRTAARNGIRVSLSNPCFELWLLLHFQQVTGYRTSAEAQKLLGKQQSCGYRSDRKHLDYSALRPLHSEACARARKLRGMSEQEHGANPWTDVDLLVEGLITQRDLAR